MITAILSWPDSFDFPLFRNRLALLNQYAKIIVCFTKHGNHPLREWLSKNMDCLFLNEEDSPYVGDWRNKSTNWMIDHVETDYVLSLEQDFLIKDYQHFFNTVNKSDTDIVMFQEYNERGGRFHPAFLLCKTDLLKGKHHDFSVMGRGLDHFAKVTRTLKNHTYTSLQNLDLLPDKDWYHLQGLTDNYFAPKPYFKLDEFYEYNEACKQVEPMSNYWRQELIRCSGEPGNKLKDFLYVL